MFGHQNTTPANLSRHPCFHPQYRAPAVPFSLASSITHHYQLITSVYCQHSTTKPPISLMPDVGPNELSHSHQSYHRTQVHAQWHNCQGLMSLCPAEMKSLAKWQWVSTLSNAQRLKITDHTHLHWTYPWSPNVVRWTFWKQTTLHSNTRIPLTNLPNSH
jgi:hypothetical protein